MKVDRPVNHDKLYIGAGFGRTGTTSLHSIVQAAEHLKITSYHSGKIANWLPRMGLSAGANNSYWNRFDRLFPDDSIARAVLDIPVGEFVWDLMAAFPDNSVVLSVRPVRRPCDIVYYCSFVATCCW
jgi:hypothetical protein